uniref:Uncharacterized protein n=1 Tax=Brassica campestris TaxID=3711 RepID=A0A3P5YPX7_BRACM|nr:unnamed protein product [Brassica rapa]
MPLTRLQQEPSPPTSIYILFTIMRIMIRCSSVKEIKISSDKSLGWSPTQTNTLFHLSG